MTLPKSNSFNPRIRKIRQPFLQQACRDPRLNPKPKPPFSSPASQICPLGQGPTLPAGPSPFVSSRISRGFGFRQRVHVGMWYILRARKGSHKPTLRPKYISYCYMHPLGIRGMGCFGTLYQGLSRVLSRV